MAQRVELVLANGFEAAWAAAHPWFARARREALLAHTPWVVLAPNRTMGHALKARLLADGMHLGGVFFWTPGELRDHLRRQLPDAPHLAVREHLHLLLASVANGPDAPREPGRLMRALDQLRGAGCGAAELDFAPAEQWAARLDADLQAAGWTTVQAFDWKLAANPPSSAIHHLLLLGFDAAHWELWPLLQAAVRASDHALVLLTPPRSKAEELDQVWIGSWEQAFGAAEPGDGASAATPFHPLAQRMENPEGATAGDPANIPPLRIGRTLREQADAIVAQALAYVCEPEAQRIGLVFPGPGPLAREVSALLLRRGVPHFDAFGHSAPPPPLAERWQAWIALQRAPLVESVRRLVAIDPSAAPPERFENELARAETDVLVDDIDVVRQRLLDFGSPAAMESAHFLARYVRLPADATLDGFTAATREAWLKPGWTDLVTELDAQVHALAPLAARRLSLGAWLDWLESVAPRPALIRAPDAANPLARIHVLGYAQAEGLPWTHLVLAGLNEGEWPPALEPSGFLSEDRIAALNRAAITQGNQGEGHATVKPGRAILPGGYERREVQRRQFYNLVETPTHGLALACALEGEDGGGRVLPASDFLSHLYFCARGEPLSESTMHAHAARTRGWLARWPAPPSIEPPEQPVPVAQAAAAHRARRSAGPFGPYECAFSGPPPKPAQLSCKAWESAVRDPAAAWLKTYLGVQPVPDFSSGELWPITRGTWVHRWLAAALCAVRGRFETRHGGAALLDRVRQSATATQRAIAHSFTAAGRAEPQWWRARLAQAEWMALQFAQRLAELSDWPQAAVEWTLPATSGMRTKGGRLALRGRIDLLFAREPADAIPRAGWVVDFKTGQENPLSERTLPRSLCGGHGIQIALYALALADAGAEDVQVSLLTPEDDVKPQVGLNAIRAQDALWTALARMQDTGIFGITGQLRSEYGVSLELPLATLAVEPALLDEKWALTHPDLAGVEDSDGAD
ncbi:MAG TPA: PD-(D/E)XK nuclease family protein [Kiritimatiellia bacterium]|nr:PD-(D/E)XK nuclease family protein [Kiritimatiellia bacterium]